MSKVQVSQLQQQFKEKLNAVKKNKSLKNNEIANITGRTESTVSEILNDKRAFSDTLIYSMLNKLTDYLQEGDLVTSLRQYNAMMNIVAKCKDSSDMRLMVGNTGIGKTKVLQKFASENECAYYFKFDRDLTWNKFLLEINRVMGIEVDKKTTNVLLENIIRKVEQTSGSRPILLLDESEIAKKHIFRNIKNLYTATEGLLAILICGITTVKHTIAKMAGLEIVRYNNQSLAAYIEHFHLKSDENNVFTTLARRLKVFHVDTTTPSDIEDFCMAKGIHNKEFLKLAKERWWNYADADRAVKRAITFKFNLSTMGAKEFETL